MRSVDPRALAIMQTIAEFEDSVACAEQALVERDWSLIDTLLSNQHRLTHALANALDETRGHRPQTFTDEVNRRIAGICEQRADQLRRLTAFNHLVKKRLTMIARTKEMRRVNVDSRTASRIVDRLQ